MDIHQRINNLPPEQKERFLNKLQKQKDIDNKQKMFIKIKDHFNDQGIPIIFCHSPTGLSGYYEKLARHIHGAGDIYGIQSRVYCGYNHPISDVEEMASEYIEILENIIPQGIVCLGGHSSGAHIAFEMAIQLQKKSRLIPSLFILDEIGPVVTDPMEIDMIRMLSATEIYESPDMLYLPVKLLSALHDLPFKLDYQSFIEMDMDSQFTLIGNFLAQAGFLPSTSTKDDIYRLLNTFSANNIAAVNYKEKMSNLGELPRYDGSIYVFKACEEVNIEEIGYSFPVSDSVDMEWSGFCSSSPLIFDIHGANHLTLMSEPFVKIIGEQIDKCMSNIFLK